MTLKVGDRVVVTEKYDDERLWGGFGEVIDVDDDSGYPIAVQLLADDPGDLTAFTYDELRSLTKQEVALG